MKVSKPVSEGYVERVRRALDSVDSVSVERFVALLLLADSRGSAVFVLGNGGSAATASHMATDLGVGSLRRGRGLRVFSLADNSAALTATGNDISYEEIFSQQLRLMCREGDVVIAISASGNSPNLLCAVKTASELGAHTVGLSGFNGGKLRRCVDLSVHVSTEEGDYGPVEDVHLVVNHWVTEEYRRRALTVI